MGIGRSENKKDPLFAAMAHQPAWCVCARAIKLSMPLPFKKFIAIKWQGPPHPALPLQHYALPKALVDSERIYILPEGIQLIFLPSLLSLYRRTAQITERRIRLERKKWTELRGSCCSSKSTERLADQRKSPKAPTERIQMNSAPSSSAGGLYLLNSGGERKRSMQIDQKPTRQGRTPPSLPPPWVFLNTLQKTLTPYIENALISAGRRITQQKEKKNVFV